MAMHKVDTDRVSRMLISALDNTSGPIASRIVDEYVVPNGDGSEGSDERRMMISRELFSVYTALLCFVIEKVYVKRASRSLLDEFLSDAKALFFEKFKPDSPSVFAEHQRRTAEYADVLHNDDEGTRLSAAFLRNLDLESIANTDTQGRIAERFKVSLYKALDLYGRSAKVIT